MGFRTVQRELGDFIVIMRRKDYNKSLLRIAINVANNKAKLADVKKSMSLSDYEEWVRDYLEPAQKARELPAILASMIDLMGIQKALTIQVEEITAQLRDWNDSLNKLKANYDEAMDAKDFDKAIKLTNDIAALENQISRGQLKTGVSQMYVDRYTAEIDSLRMQITDRRSFGILKLLGIL